MTKEKEVEKPVEKEPLCVQDLVMDFFSGTSLEQQSACALFRHQRDPKHSCPQKPNTPTKDKIVLWGPLVTKGQCCGKSLFPFPHFCLSALV